VNNSGISQFIKSPHGVEFLYHSIGDKRAWKEGMDIKEM
jgi:hypothetical protein